MDTTKLIAVITILITLSVATERLVEVVRGIWAKIILLRGTSTNVEDVAVEIPTVEGEAWKKARISFLAIVCGIATSWLASPILANLFKGLFPDGSVCGIYTVIGSPDTKGCGFNYDENGWFIIIALGLLASGGSALWNSILEYLLKVKDIKAANATSAKARAALDVDTARTAIDESNSLRINNSDKNPNNDE